MNMIYSFCKCITFDLLAIKNLLFIIIIIIIIILNKG